MNVYKKTLFAFLPTIPLYFWWVYIVTSDPVHIFGFLAYFYLMITLSVSPISTILRRWWNMKYAISLTLIRRQLGILTWVFAFLHIFKFYERVWNMYLEFFSQDQNLFQFLLVSLQGKNGTIFWMDTWAYSMWTIGIIIIIALVLSSNNYSQKLLGGKKWKRLQRLVYPLFLIVVLHIYFIGWWKGAYLYPALFLILMKTYVYFSRK